MLDTGFTSRVSNNKVGSNPHRLNRKQHEKYKVD